MSRSRNTVAIGILGTKLDAEKHGSRWETWRPSVALGQHEDLLLRRFELLHAPGEQRLAEAVRDDLALVSPETEVRLHELAFTDPWDFEPTFGVLLDFARDYTFDPDAEDYLVHITTGTHVCQICLFLLTESRHLPGRLIQTSPARRAEGRYRIIDLDLSRYDAIAQRFEREHRQDLSFLKEGIDTRNAAFNRLIERIEKVALLSREPLLLTGPTGAGKSRLARRIYELKLRRHQLASGGQAPQGQFVEVNCATLRGDQAMSALFGHKRGAFTGALQDRPGLLRAANGGVLFLDEIGELGLDEQAMLLRALEEKRFLPMGSDREAESDFQLLAGTNRDLRAAVREGRFREDLLARINLWTFALPGLAERREDVEPNLDWELDQRAVRSGAKVTMSREARRLFLDFATSPNATWQGNFRDLNGAVVRMSTLAAGGRITEDVAREEIERLSHDWQPQARPRPDDDESVLRSVLGEELLAELDLFDRVQLAEVVRVCRRSRSLAEAGRELFAVSRTHKKVANDADRLRKYLKRFALDWDVL